MELSIDWGDLNSTAALSADVIETIFAEAYELARKIVPVDTGFLRDSIGYNRRSIWASAHYASYVEFGTDRMRAQPYLWISVMSAYRKAISNYVKPVKPARRR
jgi:hypothetical protein